MVPPTSRTFPFVGLVVIVALVSARPVIADQCHDAVQGRIAWDYQGHTAWVPANVDRLCQGASSVQPARCFARVMHGGVNWGGGTQWQWSNAIDLCAGTSNSQATIACFQRGIAGGQSWSAAIASCKAPNLRVPIQIVGTMPVPSPPVCPVAGQGSPQRTVTGDGTVEVRLPDGQKILTRPGVCGSTRILPDGRSQTFACNQAQPATMPEAPGPGARIWLDAHNESLMSIIRGLLDSASVDNYVSSVESDHPEVYDQIKLRTALIQQLTAAN
jgi:hypothetical protein